MTYDDLVASISRKKSFLCIGLDSDLNRIPAHFHSEADPILAFNKAIVDATYDLAVAYKPNVAFYESYGAKGWECLQKTAEYVKYKYPDVLLIADAKRGDIGNTAKKYAETFFKQLPFDAVTVSPYMGVDSITPFLEYKDKWTIVLALTSNQGASDFQLLKEATSGAFLFEQVLKTISSFGGKEQIMFVTGATQTNYLNQIRKLVPEHFLLVPGLGAQGGNLEEVVKNTSTQSCGLLVNASRSIIYASTEIDFAKKVRATALSIQQQMQQQLKELGLFNG